MVKFKENDIYAIKIENKENEYDGEYLILIKVKRKEWLPSTNKHLFRFKITKNKQLPTLKEINNLEYIKTHMLSYLGIFFPYDSEMTKKERIQEIKKIKPYLDEYKYLYTYISKVKFVYKNIPENLIYIGNKLIDPPVDEYYPSCEYGYIMSFFSLENIVEDVLKCYENYNKKKSNIYEKNSSKKIHENYKKDLKFFANTYKEIEKMDKRDFNEVETEESLTYVGEDDEEP